MRIANYFDTAICEYALYSKGVSAAVACNDFHIKGAFAKINEKKILNRLAVPNNFILSLIGQTYLPLYSLTYMHAREVAYTS